MCGVKPIHRSLQMLTKQILKLIEERVPESVLTSDIYREIFSALWEFILNCGSAIIARSESDAKFCTKFRIQVCEDTDARINTIVRYIVDLFDDADNYASRFKDFSNEFVLLAANTCTRAETPKMVGVLIDSVSIYKDRVRCIYRLLHHISSFEQRTDQSDHMSRDNTQVNLENLYKETQKELYRAKCMLAFVAVTHDIDAATEKLIRVALKNCRESYDIAVCTDVHNLIVLTSRLDFDIRGTMVLDDYVRQCAVLRCIAFFCDACRRHVC